MNWQEYIIRVGKIPMNCERIDVVVGTSDRPASQDDIDSARTVFSQAIDHLYSTRKVCPPNLSVGAVVGQFPSCKMPRLVEVHDVATAVNPSLIGMPDDGLKLILIGSDDWPASQETIDDADSDLSKFNAGTWIISHHAIDVTYC